MYVSQIYFSFFNFFYSLPLLQQSQEQRRNDTLKYNQHVAEQEARRAAEATVALYSSEGRGSGAGR